MTDELKFFDPEIGKPLHRVPEGATIPAGMPCGYIDSRRKRWWWAEGLAVDVVQRDYPPRFTREPIAPPTPPLPTEPGFYADREGDLWKLVGGGMWELVDGCIYSRQGVASYAPFVPVTLVPTETWDRLRVLDPEDTRDRVDRDGDRIRLTTQTKAVWGTELAAGHWYRGPLRFADEVSDR